MPRSGLSLDDILGDGGGSGAGKKCFTALAKLRVRSSCAKDAEIIYEIRKGEVFEALEERGDWTKVGLTVSPFPEAWIISRSKVRPLIQETTDAPTVFGNVLRGGGDDSDAPAAAPAAAAAPPPKPASAPAPPPTAKAAEPAAPPPAKGNFYIALANMALRRFPDPAAAQLSEVTCAPRA